LIENNPIKNIVTTLIFLYYSMSFRHLFQGAVTSYLVISVHHVNI
jgi:hypothetical protein